MMRRFVLIAFNLLLASCALKTLAAQSNAPPATTTPAKPTHSSVFDHKQADHAKMACQTCHTRSGQDPAAVEPRRPGHAACWNCHSTENYLDTSASEPLCVGCHPANHVLDAFDKTQVLAFPRELKQFGVSAFSHRVHMDDAKMTSHPEGYGCQSCHTGGLGTTAKNFPAHPECYSCHEHQAGQKFGRCQDCHALIENSLAFSHVEGAAARDYHFLHSGHTKRKDETPIACAACHELRPELKKVSDIARMEPMRGEHHTSSCWGVCHTQKAETRCGKCHVQGVPLPAGAS
jgi:hypothetical protein